MTERELKTIENMEKYGGSFVKALANCFRHADSKNFFILRVAFDDYWTKYVTMHHKENDMGSNPVLFFDEARYAEDPAGDMSGASDDDGEGR